jgi:hypothetical protein
MDDDDLQYREHKFPNDVREAVRHTLSMRHASLRLIINSLNFLLDILSAYLHSMPFQDIPYSRRSYTLIYILF